MNVEQLTNSLKAIDTTGVLAVHKYDGQWEVQLRGEDFLRTFGIYELEIREVEGKKMWFAHVYRNEVKFVGILPVEKVGDYV